MIHLFVGYLFTNAQNFDEYLRDYSPNCQSMMKSYPICNDVLMQYVCLKSCAYEKEFPLTCGKRHVVSSQFQENNTAKRARGKYAGSRKFKLAVPKFAKEKRIVGGTESEEGSWPWQVALMFKGKQHCGGALISPGWVATAAHCFGKSTSKIASDWSVVLGEYKLASTDKFEQYRQVKKIIIHPQNFRYSDIGYHDIPDDYDIALVQLSHAAVLSDWVNTICLPDDLVSFPHAKQCYIAGWGKTQWGGSQPDALREAVVKLVARTTCNSPESYNGKVHQRAICAGYADGGVDACQYDSGGALACEFNGRFYVHGLVSWGIGCARKFKYGVYANVPILRGWIVETILNEEPTIKTIANRLNDVFKPLLNSTELF
eukprot:gene7416-13175_t